MAEYMVDINGTFTAVLSVTIDDDTPEDEIEQAVYDIAEKQLNEKIAKFDYSDFDNIEFETVDHTEITD